MGSDATAFRNIPTMHLWLALTTKHHNGGTRQKVKFQLRPPTRLVVKKLSGIPIRLTGKLWFYEITHNVM